MITIGEKTYGGRGNPNDNRHDVPGIQRDKADPLINQAQNDFRDDRVQRRKELVAVFNEVRATLGGKGHVVIAGNMALQDWIDDKSVHHKFDEVGDIIQKLKKEGWLWAESDGTSLGPSNLGKRPAFDGDSAKMKAGKGNDRRHVISASTLGRAAEKSTASKAEVEAFIERHTGVKKEYADINLAKAEAWRMLNSVKGNLWAGPSGDNRVAGFIRGPIHNAQTAIREADPSLDAQQVIRDAIKDISKPTGPLRSNDRESWKPMSDVAVGVPDSENLVDPKLTQGLITARLDGSAGPYTKEEAIADLEDFEMNADLDLPKKKMETGYYKALSSIYIPVRATADSRPTDKTPDLFAKDGPLDQFMKLDCEKMEQSAVIVNQMRDKFEKLRVPTVPDVSPAKVDSPQPGIEIKEVIEPDPHEKSQSQEVSDVEPMNIDSSQPEIEMQKPGPDAQSLAQGGADVSQMPLDDQPQIKGAKEDLSGKLKTRDFFRHSADSQPYAFKEGTTGAELSAAKNEKKRKFYNSENNAVSNKERPTARVDGDGQEKPSFKLS